MRKRPKKITGGSPSTENSPLKRTSCTPSMHQALAALDLEFARRVASHFFALEAADLGCAADGTVDLFKVAGLGVAALVVSESAGLFTTVFGAASGESLVLSFFPPCALAARFFLRFF